MSRVRSGGNKSTELALIALFRRNSIIGWRRNYALYGHPDFVFPKSKLAIFADGCFWHGHNCRNTRPSDNYAYWKNKISNNKKRDRRATALLKRKGWIVVRIWECEIKKMSNKKIVRLKIA